MDHDARVAVYTAITGGRDLLQEDQCFEGADFFAFVDDPPAASRWTLVPACREFDTPRRNAKAHKVLAHRYLAEYDYSLWIDGSMRLLCPVRDLIRQYLVDSDLAVFKHHCRDCIYDEAEVCQVLQLDDELTIGSQMARYHDEGYPRHNGLMEAGVLLRRHTAGIKQFNNRWWSEICGGSIRDQLSANYVLHRLGIRPAMLPQTIYSSDAFDYCGHAESQGTRPTLAHLDTEVRRLSAAYGILLSKFEKASRENAGLLDEVASLREAQLSLIFTDPYST